MEDISEKNKWRKNTAQRRMKGGAQLREEKRTAQGRISGGRQLREE